jgi:hypothetical protein
VSWRLRPYGRLIWLAGEEQPDNAAVIPDRLVVLYSTHRPEFSWKKIGEGKKQYNTPASINVSKPFNLYGFCFDDHSTPVMSRSAS